MSKLRLRLEPPRTTPTEHEAVSGALVGRSRQCDIRINDEKASGRHSQFILESGRFFIVDLGSSNHTIIDGGTVLKKGDRHELAVGLRVQIGRTWIEVLELEGVAGALPPEPGTSLPTLEQPVPGLPGDRTIPLTSEDQTLPIPPPSGPPPSGPPPGPAPASTDGFGEMTMPQGRALRPADPLEAEPTMPQSRESKPGTTIEPTMALPAGKRPADSKPPTPAAAAPRTPTPNSPAPNPEASPSSGADVTPDPPIPPSAFPAGDALETLDSAPDEFSNVAVGVVISKTRPRLVVARTGRVDTIEIPHSPFVMGRGDHLQPPGRIDHPSVSKEHCQLVFRDGAWYVVPFKANTQIDGRPAQGGEPVPLRSESWMQLGGLLILFVADPVDKKNADRELYAIALDVLLNRKRITRDQRKTAETNASATQHVGEVLIHGEIVGPDVWHDAYKSAIQLRDAGMVPKRGLSPRTLGVLVGVAAVVIVAIAWWFAR